MAQTFHAIGKRKTSIARVFMKNGEGAVVVNGKPVDQYFAKLYMLNLERPFKVLGSDLKFDVSINVHGGGPSSQSEACMFGISKALTLVSTKNRAPLKKEMLLTRDSRIVERKKYGHKKARKSFQYSKR